MFSIEDLKPLYLVKLRCGEYCLVVPQKHSDRYSLIDKSNRVVDLFGYDGLKHRYENELDIIEVYGNAVVRNSLSFDTTSRDLLYQEFDWSKVPIDTKVQVRNGERLDWCNRYFYGIKITDEKIKYQTFAHGSTSFSCSDNEYTGQYVLSTWNQIRLYKE